MIDDGVGAVENHCLKSQGEKKPCLIEVGLLVMSPFCPWLAMVTTWCVGDPVQAMPQKSQGGSRDSNDLSITSLSS